MPSLEIDVDEILAVLIPEEKKQEETPAPHASKKTNRGAAVGMTFEEIPSSHAPKKTNLGAAMGMTFDKVGGLDNQLDAIARRVLASRANPATARRLGVSHVRGILLSGPPGCGKTLLARELAHILGAREPQIVNGPEILDKFIGEAEKKVRELFAPAEQEYRESGDDSALHIIILDEMDAIARKRGSMTSDTTGVLMDGVKEASNVLVVGLTNRPELLDPALLRPGRLEVQLRVELPDLLGRRDILRIHTRRMIEAGGMSPEAVEWIEDVGEHGLATKAEHFSGAEIAGLVRSAASFALARTVQMEQDDQEAGVVSVGDLKQALKEVRPALGKQDEVLRLRYPLGISPCSSSMKRIIRDLERFTAPLPSKAPRLQSLLLVGAGGNGGAGATALCAWAAAGASASGAADYVRFVTALDLLSEGGGGDEVRASALVERFAEAREMSHSLLVLDDVNQLCAGSGPGGYSSIMIATLRALLRSPPASSSTAKAGGQSTSKRSGGKTIHILAATSRSDAACVTLHELFDETIGRLPLLVAFVAAFLLLTMSVASYLDCYSSLSYLMPTRCESFCQMACFLA
jgi:vesicle-fusing ATPase